MAYWLEDIYSMVGAPNSCVTIQSSYELDNAMYSLPYKFKYLVPLEFLITFGLILFHLSLLGLIFNRQKTIISFMLFVELTLFSLSFLSVIFSIMLGSVEGQILALYIIAIAAAESVIGLGIMLGSFKINSQILLNSFSGLKY